MDSAITPTAQLFQVSGHLFAKSLDGLTPEELFRAPESANPMIWLAGHLTYCRCAIARYLGKDRELPWPRLFGRHSKIAGREDYPDIGAIRSLWDDVSRSLSQDFEKLTAEQLSSTIPADLPIADRTLRGALVFMAWHEAYHTGQMAYLRKWLGHGGLIDG